MMKHQQQQCCWIHNDCVFISYAIAPWNAPLILTVRAVATPILCGNTVVLKCSEVSPRTQAITVELLTEVCFFVLSD